MLLCNVVVSFFIFWGLVGFILFLKFRRILVVGLSVFYFYIFLERIFVIFFFFGFICVNYVILRNEVRELCLSLVLF